MCSDIRTILNSLRQRELTHALENQVLVKGEEMRKTDNETLKQIDE